MGENLNLQIRKIMELKPEGMQLTLVIEEDENGYIVYFKDSPLIAEGKTVCGTIERLTTTLGDVYYDCYCDNLRKGKT